MRKTGSAPTVVASDGRPLLNCSQMAEWSRCRYRWHLTTVRHILPRGFHRRLDLGSAVHAGMDAVFKAYADDRFDGKYQGIAHKAVTEWANKEQADRRLPNEELVLLEEIEGEAKAILDRQLSVFPFHEWEVIKDQQGPVVERGLTLSLPSAWYWGGIHGTVDLMLRNKQSGLRVVLDWKTRTQFTQPEDDDVNFQLATYQFLGEANGLSSDGTLMYQIKSAAPKTPKRNKDGSMSRVRIATDWPTYLLALRAAGLDPHDYEAEMRPKLDVAFESIQLHYRSAVEQQAVYHDITLPIAESMVRERDHQFRNMNSWNCKGCRVRAFCLAELKDEDTDFLLKTDFINTDDPAEQLPFDVSMFTLLED